QILAGLGNRIFLMNNVHEDQPEVFETRWSLSYLRGPLTRNQIKSLMDVRKAQPLPSSQEPASRGGREAAAVSPPSKGSVAETSSSVTTTQRPVLPAEVPQYFVALRGNQPASNSLHYRPLLFGCSKVYYSDPKKGVDSEQNISYLAQISDGPVSVDWQQASQVDLVESDLEKTAAQEAVYEAVPSEASKLKSYENWKRLLAEALYRSQKLDLFLSPALEQLSKPGESERDFRVRLQQAAREERDQRVEK